MKALPHPLASTATPRHRFLPHPCRHLAGTLCLALFGLLLAGCGDAPAPSASINSSDPAASESIDTAPTDTADTATSTSAKPGQDDAVIEVEFKTSLGAFTARLYPDKAPQTVDNFLFNYVNREFYRGTIFHYVDAKTMIAGGGYLPDLTPKQPQTWITNESTNGLSNRRGTLAMVRQADYPDSADCQFFINLKDNPELDHQPKEDEDTANGYCVFGEVVKGMDVVDRIAQVPVADREVFPSVPKENVVIQSVSRVR